ncbi:glycine betaine ABC transporter substrate-binding protein [Sinorhizobium sp. RAC02]|uniref:ABC transporter substrate-binding protein n=1 Tax=Sinorhizobium sp. RAC02 TaxID=1842534 RepID=UPI00083E4CE1|nr:glycine betaine ABC transporter substrate-binding protein [Sinorhizobium sp. RAC02]AOF93193.1 substrate binding domain of ABC-type glycine betaine transport system family protein [Sinorhizobium sp. RAC02]
MHTALKILFATSTALAVLIPAAAQAAPITVADPGYATAQGTAYVVKILLEEQLGKEVEAIKAGSVPVIWEALNRNGGEIDIWTDVWLPNQQALVDQYAGENGKVKLAANSYAGTQGYCTTKVTADKHGIHSVFDLADPAKAAVFSADGKGKGKIWLGAAGWLSTNIETVRARDYGFADFFDLQTTDEAVATADLDAAVKAGTGWIGYCYGPHQNFARYELEVLEEPKHDDAAWNFVEPSDPNWLEKSSIKSAYKDAAIHIAYSKSLAENAPEVAAILERVTFTTDAVSKLAFAIAVEGRNPDDAARDWIAANPDVVAGWVGN